MNIIQFLMKNVDIPKLVYLQHNNGDWSAFEILSMITGITTYEVRNEIDRVVREYYMGKQNARKTD